MQWFGRFGRKRAQNGRKVAKQLRLELCLNMRCGEDEGGKDRVVGLRKGTNEEARRIGSS